MAAPSKRLFPAFLDLQTRLCVVVGEGPTAEKRVRQLLRYGADVVVVSPNPSKGLREAEADGLLSLERRGYVRGDLQGASLVICVSDDEELQRAVFDEAESVACLANISGAPELSSFILPSVFHRGPLQIAISTGGEAPAAAKELRRRFEAEIGDEWGSWIVLLGEVRVLVMESIEDAEERVRILAAASDPSVRERIASGEEISAEGLVEELSGGTPAKTD